MTLTPASRDFYEREERECHNIVTPGAETRRGMGDTSSVNCAAGLLNSQPIFKEPPPADTNQADRARKCNAVGRKFVMALTETFQLYFIQKQN